MPNSTTLTRAAARNPASWSVERATAGCQFRAICGEAVLYVTSAYNRIFFVHNVTKGTNYRVDTGGTAACSCPDWEHRHQDGTCCRHIAAAVAVQRFTQGERLVNDAPVAAAARDEVIVLGEGARAVRTARFVEEIFA